MAEEKTPEDIEKEKKELDNKKRLTQQSLLLMNLQELSKLNRDVYTKGEKSYKNFLLLEDPDPWSVMTRLMGVNMLPSTDLKSEHFTALVPEIRFFIEEVDNQRKLTIQEISFPTHAGTEQKKRYNQSIHSSIAATTAPNIGIQSIDWSTQGKNPYLDKSSFVMNIKLYAERISDFFARVPGTKKARYSDMFSHRTDTQNKTRLKMQVGWSINPEYENVIGKETKDPNKRKKIKHAIKQMREQKDLLDLSLTSFDFDFTEEGAVSINVTYRSYIDDRLSSRRNANLLFDQNAKKKENSLKEEIEKLKGRLNEGRWDVDFETMDEISGGSWSEYGLLPEPQGPQKNDEVDYSNVMKKIEEKERALAEVGSNRAAMYASFVEGLILNGRIKTYTVAEENLLYRHNLHTQSKSPAGDSNTVCDMPTSKNFPDLFFVKNIPVAGGDNESSFQKGTVKMYVTKEGERKYAFFEPGASEPSILPPMNDVLYTEKQILDLAQQLGHNQSSEDTILSYLDTSVLSPKKTLEDCSSSELSPAEQSSMSKKVNAAVKKATEMPPEKGNKEVAKVFDAVSKPEYADGYYNIKYFFLGDLMEVAISKLRANPSFAQQLDGFTKFVSGPIQLNNYGSDADIYGLKDLSIKNGVLEASRKGGTKSKSKKVQKPQTYTRNISDIPVSLNCFLHFFNEEYVGKNTIVMSFEDFIKAVMKLALRSIKFTDEDMSLVPKQDVNLTKSSISVPVETIDGNKKDYFGFDESGKPPANSRVSLSSILTSAAGRKNKDDSFEQYYGANGLSLREAKLGRGNNPGDSPTKNYVILHNIQKGIPPENEMDFIKDSKMGIAHFFIGGRQGLLKNISFSLVQNKSMRDHFMVKDAKSSKHPTLPLAGRYNAQITLFGNTFFTPGSVVCINPASMRLGNHKNINSPINQIGIAGYYTVKKVSNYIQGGRYETKLECAWAGTGNGHTRDGTHHTKTGITKEK